MSRSMTSVTTPWGEASSSCKTVISKTKMGRVAYFGFADDHFTDMAVICPQRDKCKAMEGNPKVRRRCLGTHGVYTHMFGNHLILNNPCTDCQKRLANETPST